MIRRLALLILALVAYAIQAPSTASAHDYAAVTQQAQAGPYHLEISLDRETPRTGQPLDVAVRMLSDGAVLHWNGGARIKMVARPAAGTDATQTRQIMLQPESHDRTSFAGTVQVPVRGAWTLEIQASGPEGEATTAIPLIVAGPPVIPFWLGWTVGLSPLLGLAWFARWNWRFLRRELSGASVAA